MPSALDRGLWKLRTGKGLSRCCSTVPEASRGSRNSQSLARLSNSTDGNPILAGQNSHGSLPYLFIQAVPVVFRDRPLGYTRGTLDGVLDLTESLLKVFPQACACFCFLRLGITAPRISRVRDEGRGFPKGLYFLRIRLATGPEVDFQTNWIAFARLLVCWRLSFTNNPFSVLSINVGIACN